MIPLFKFKVVGHSMEPALLNCSFVLVSSIPYLFVKSKVGDVIVFKREEKIFIKRIAKINGEKYFVKGDNEKDSVDGKKFGWIDRKDIVGKVLIKI